MSDFWTTLFDLESRLQDKLSENHPIQMTCEDEKKFQDATECHICDQPFKTLPNGKLDKVKDHCHLNSTSNPSSNSSSNSSLNPSSNFLGAACNNCNLQRRIRKEIVAFAHCGSKFDFNLLLDGLTDVMQRVQTMSGIASNSQKFKSFKVNNYRFLDSFSFLPSSLEVLTSSLKTKQDHSYVLLDQSGLYKKHEEEKKKMMLEKGHFFYNYLDSEKVLSETEFPPKSAFYSDLSNTDISDEDYNFARSVYRTFGCKNLQDFLILYQISDVFLLSEVFYHSEKKS